MPTEYESSEARAARRAALWAAHRRRAMADVAALFARADGALMAFVDANILPFVAGMIFAGFLMWLVSA